MHGRMKFVWRKITKKALGDLFDQYRREGFDAVVFGDTGNPGSLIVSVLGNSAQIKSAIGNRNFNPNKKGLVEGREIISTRFGDISVLVNPTPKQTVENLKKTENRIMRGVLYGGDIFMWNSVDATHDTIGEAIAGDDRVIDFYVVLNKDVPFFRIYAEDILNFLTHRRIAPFHNSFKVVWSRDLYSAQYAIDRARGLVD